MLAIGAFAGYANKDTLSARFMPTNNVPLPNMNARPQLLRFGMYVTPDPDQNPISPPERFIGYHAALDLEIIEGEEDKDVPVRAVCNGTIVLSTSIKGYGGTIVQQCTLKEQIVTVLYGHLDLSSLSKIDSETAKGQVIGKLAPAGTEDSGHTRKHLHLGIHKGETIDVRGYVQNEKELEAFIDPKEILDI